MCDEEGLSLWSTVTVWLDSLQQPSPHQVALLFLLALVFPYLMAKQIESVVAHLCTPTAAELMQYQTLIHELLWKAPEWGVKFHVFKLMSHDAPFLFPSYVSVVNVNILPPCLNNPLHCCIFRTRLVALDQSQSLITALRHWCRWCEGIKKASLQSIIHCHSGVELNQRYSFGKRKRIRGGRETPLISGSQWCRLF